MTSRFLSNPRKEHWDIVKWILGYLRGTSNACLCFRGRTLVLKGFIDADLVGDLDHRKSILGFLFTYTREAMS